MGSKISSLTQKEIDERKQERDQMIADSETQEKALQAYFHDRATFWGTRIAEQKPFLESNKAQLESCQRNWEQYLSATAARDAACKKNIYDAFNLGQFDTECLSGGHQKFSSAYSPGFIRSLKNYTITPVVEPGPVGDIDGIVCYRPQVTKWSLKWEK